MLSKSDNTYWVAVVERFTVLFQSVEKLDIVFGLIGEVCDGHVLFLPRLKERNQVSNALYLEPGASLDNSHLEKFRLCSHEYIDDGPALRTLDTGGEGIKLGHSLLPVL